MKKLWTFILTLCLVFSNFITILNPVNAEENNSILDSAKLIHNDGTENREWKLSEPINLVYEWSIKKFEKGYAETFNLPIELKIEKEINSNLTTSDEINLGTVKVTTEGKVTVNITDESNYIENNKNAKGILTIKTTFNKNIVEGTYNIDFGIGSDKYEINVINDGQQLGTNDKSVDKTLDLKTGKGEVVLTLIDSKDKSKLDGAIFDLYDSAGNIVKEGLSTDTEGKVIVKNLESGNYYFVETKAPHGYVLNSEPKRFEIKSIQLIPVILIKENDKEDLIKPYLGSIMLVAVDYESDYNMTGVEYKLLDRKENTINEGLVTDRNGKITLKNIKPGKYLFVKSNVPEGYRLDDEKLEVIVKPGELTVVKSINYKNGVYPPNHENEGNNSNNSGSSNNEKNSNNANNISLKNPIKSGKLPQTGGILGNTGTLFVGLFLVVGGVYLYNGKKFS